MSHPRLLYDLLFHCAAESLLAIAADPKHLGARIGLLAILHTWSQKLTLHPHLHCLVPAGGLSIDGDWWVRCRRRFFLPVRVLSKLYRGKFLAALRAAVENGDLPPGHLLALGPLYCKPWMVYSKPPFGSPQQVLAYLARYTHRVALTNQRLAKITDEEVTFTWKDYADAETQREMTLSGHEFLRRFLLHILPDGFVRIRYYGLFANRHREQKVALCRNLLPGPPPPKLEAQTWQTRLERLTGIDPLLCTACGQPAMRCIELLAPMPVNGSRAPPGS